MKTNNQNTETRVASVNDLTSAELELIRIKREEEKLAAEKKVAETKAEEEKQIAAAELAMVKDLKSQEQLNAAIEALFIELKAFDDTYRIQVKVITKEYKKSHYLSSEERIAKGMEKEVYFLKYQQLEVKQIFYPLTKTIISSKHYSVDTSSARSFHSHLEYRGIRFSLSIPGVYDSKNDSLKSAKTIHEKLDTFYQTNKRRTEYAQQKRTGTEWLLNTLAEMYPAAEIKENQHPGKSYGGYRSSKNWTEGEKYVEVKFKNGFELQYGYHKVMAIEEGEETSLKINLQKIVTIGLSPEDKQKYQDTVITMFTK